MPVGLFALRLTSEGQPAFLFVSRRLLEMLRLARDQVLAEPALAFARIHPDDATDFERRSRASVVRAAPLLWEGRLLIDGVHSWVRIEGVPQVQIDGSSVWQGVLSDISASKRTELDLRRILDNAPIGIAANAPLSDPDPEITYLNRQFLRTLGYDRAAIPRLSDWARLAYPDPAYRAVVMRRWAKALERARREEGAVESIEAEVMAADGSVRSVLISAVILEQDQLLISLLDVTELRQAERNLREARAELAETALAITEAIPVGTFTMVLPPGGELASFAFMSERFLQICGLEREAAAADPLQAFACVHPGDREAWIRRNAEAFASRCPFQVETRIVVNGAVRWISAESVPRSLPDGSTVWEGVLSDITERIETSEQLRQEKELLAMTLESLIDPHLTLVPQRRPDGILRDFLCTDANEAACVYLARPREQLIGAPLQAVLPDTAGSDLHSRFARMLESRTPLVLNELALSPSPPAGPRFWDLRVVLVADHLSCSWRDVSDRVAAARQLAASEEQYRLLAENSSDVVMQLAEDGTIRWVSPSLTAMLGWRPDEWIGRCGTDFLEHRGEAEHYRANLRMVQGGGTVVARDRVRACDGSWHWVETHASPFRDASGAIDGAVASFRTIDAEVHAEQELARLARTDSLTGLLNRREILERLDACAARVPRSGRQTAVLFCDLDHFKPINDRYGHAAGDQLLCAVADRIRGCLRRDDLAARLGGDELLVVLPGVQDLDNAVAIAEKIRRAMLDPVPTPVGELRISLSIGVTLALPGEDSDALIARADAAMYEAKQVGRNRVIPFLAEPGRAG